MYVYEVIAQPKEIQNMLPTQLGISITATRQDSFSLTLLKVCSPTRSYEKSISSESCSVYMIHVR